MAGQYIDFENDGDTGFRESTDATEPYADTEPVDAAVLNRPAEHQRYRTEVLRTESEDTKYRNDADTKWIIAAGDNEGLNSGVDVPGVAFDKDGGGGSEGDSGCGGQ